MAIIIRNEQIEAGIQSHAEAQPTQPSKTSMTEAILRRAVQMTPDEMDRWLRGQSCCDEQQRPDAA